MTDESLTIRVVAEVLKINEKTYKLASAVIVVNWAVSRRIRSLASEAG